MHPINGTKQSIISYCFDIKQNHLFQVRPGSKVLDCGCGVGGPMRNIAVFGDCEVQGITINQYQVSFLVGTDLSARLHGIKYAYSMYGA